MSIPNSLEGEIKRRELRKDYGAFVQYANPRFYMTKFHRYLCNEIQTFLDTPSHKALDILLLSVPPRHGKSFTVTETLPAWFLGREPHNHVIIASYESTFAEAFSRRNRDKFNTFVQDVWPKSLPNDKVQGVALWETAEGGTCRAGGLKAGITGYGAELFIIDDPIKNRAEAESEVVLGKLHDEMGPSVQSRIHPGGKLIVIQTRWVEGDCIGWIQDNWGDFIWKTINLPYEYDEEAAKIGPCPLGRKIGDSLMGKHLGDDENLLPQAIMNTNEMLKSKKLLVIRADGERTWNGLYQGRPSVAQGSLYREEWWGHFVRSDELWRRLEYVSMSVDATFKNTELSDFVCIEIAGLLGRDVYLWKLINKRMDFVQTMAKIKSLYAEYPVDELIIEDKANGPAIISALQHDDAGMPIVAVNPLGGKVARGQATSNFIAQGNYKVPDFTDEENREIEWDTQEVLTGRQKFIKQHSQFPFGRRDDMVDAQTQQVTRKIKLITGEVKIPLRKHEKYREWFPDMWEDYESLREDKDREQYIRIHGAPKEWQRVG